MNNVTPERKERILKSLAVLGLFGIIIFIAWVSVRIVSIFPSALQSLASLADTVYTYNPKAMKDIVIIPTTTPIVSGTTHTLRWEQQYANGQYTFSYQCRDGVAAEIATGENIFVEAECNKNYTLGAVNQADIIIHSEKQKEINFDYTLLYFKTNATKESISASDSFIVVNNRFTEGDVPKVVITEDVITSTSTTATSSTTTTTATTSVTTTATSSTPVTPPKTPASPIVTNQTYTYSYLPESDPKGFTDLVVTYLGIGVKNSAGQFINNGKLYENVAGAIQFSVKNIGTKTSSDWTFATKLPGDNSFTSTRQNPLKPNEKATFVAAFPAIAETDLQKFSVAIKVSNDTDSTNNSISWTTAVQK